MDRIRLDGIRAYGKHGVDAAERERAQPFDDRRYRGASICGTRRRATSLPTRWIMPRCTSESCGSLANTSYALLERLAAELLDAVFEDRRIARAQVTDREAGRARRRDAVCNA